MLNKNPPTSRIIFWKKGEVISLLLLILLVVSLVPPPNALADELPRQPLVAAVHVHSTMSTGSWTLDEVVRQAKTLYLDAVILSENFSLRYEYGLFPLRGAFRIRTEFPSLMEYGIKQFLQEVEEVQARYPTIVVVPGVEVAPFYHWTGSLWDDTLTMHNAQKNLLVLGLPYKDDYAALPALGNTSSYQLGWQTLLNISPALFFIAAMWLWRRNFRQQNDDRKSIFFIWSKILTSSLVGIALALLFNAWPFSQPQFSPYNSQLAHLPYQALIDTVAQRNGVTIWSLTEAKDFSQHTINPLGRITIKTDPHPEMLLQTNNYTGFGGVYQDTRTITDPGGVWDQTLQQYLTGKRDTPPFTYGEIAFHTQGQAGIELDQVLTGVWARERTTAGVMEALRTGHAYAIGQYGHTHGLRLQEFSVECGNERTSAKSGETLILKKACSPTVKISGFTTDHAAHSVSIRIIRSGEVVSAYNSDTPFEIRFTDTQAHRKESMYYRIDVQGHGELISNPIFVTKTPASPAF